MKPGTLIPNTAEVKLVCLRHIPGAIQVEWRACRAFSKCPGCGGVSTQVHSRYRRTIADLPWQRVPVYILLQTRKFRCVTEHCSRRIFAEQLPEPYPRTADRTIGYLPALAMAEKILSGPGAVLQNVIRPAALKAGIGKKIGWHSFRHTYSTLLIANGENVKVVQELMRHASSRFTLELTFMERARQAPHYDSGGELEQIEFLLGHASVQTTERFCEDSVLHGPTKPCTTERATFILPAGELISLHFRANSSLCRMPVDAAIKRPQE